MKHRHPHLVGAPRLSLVALVLFASAPLSPAQAQWRWDGVERQVVIPDVHGAFDEFAELLKVTGVVDENLDWNGGDTHLVSLGDLLDRGPDSRKAMDLLMRLETQAAEAGGRVHVVLGNHELMLLTGDLRYVSAAEYQAFAADETEAVRARAFEWFVAHTPGVDAGSDLAREAFETAYPAGFFAMREAFSSDGHYGRWLLGLPAIVVINETAYVHAGLPELVAGMSLDELNTKTSQALDAYVRSWESLRAEGHLPRFERQDPKFVASDALFVADPARCLEEQAAVCEHLDVPRRRQPPEDAELVAALERFVELGESPALSVDGPMWYRGSVYCKPILEEPVLDAALARLGAERVVVGHTPSFDRRAHSLHDGRLIMMDTGMLVAYYRGRPAALIVENGETTVQYLQPEERTVPLTGGQVIAGRLDRAAVLVGLDEGEISVVDRPREGPWRIQVRYGGQDFEALFYEGESGRREQAAYALDEMMDLDLVPPTVGRRVDGEDGALQLWYADAITERQRVANEIGIGGWCPVDPQFGLMSMFDYLTFNAGRSEDNVLFRRNLWSLHLTGHGQAFGTQSLRPNQITELELAPGTAAALEALDEDGLKQAMDGLLDGRQVEALLARRDAILEATVGR